MLLVAAALLVSSAGLPAAEDADHVCPRCGYLNDAGWTYCVACGWDLRQLVGTEGRKRLQTIGKSVVALVVVRNTPEMSEILSPALLKIAIRYRITISTSKMKTVATAFPAGKPGLFLTSARVLDHAEYADVRTYNNQTFRAEILGFDPPTGLGVLRAQVPGVAPLATATAPPSKEEIAWAVCFPVQYEEHQMRYLPQSLHRGRITGVGESGVELVAFENLIRTDHTLPVGCPGGPLIDARGNLAGLFLEGPEPGLSYAATLAELMPLVDVLAEKKQPERPFFGIGLVPVDERRRARFGLTGNPEHPLVPYVIPGSPAEKAGVAAGDLLAAVGGEPVATVPQAGARLLKAVPSGAQVSLKLIRHGKEVAVQVAPVKRPARILLSPVDEVEETLQAILEEVSTGPTSKQGLRVSYLERGGRGEVEGYKVGDLIIEANGKSVRRLDAFNEIVRSQNGHLFGEEPGADPGALSTYLIQLRVRAEGEEKEERRFTNAHPDLLQPPVY
jgi:S1-C subfamily serine protease